MYLSIKISVGKTNTTNEDGGEFNSGYYFSLRAVFVAHQLEVCFMYRTIVRRYLFFVNREDYLNAAGWNLSHLNIFWVYYPDYADQHQ